MSDYLKKFDNCLEGSIPYCSGACPFNMEILNFMEKARRGSAKAAFNVYRNAVGFPRIVSSICPQPCKAFCPRADHGGAIELRELERASIELSSSTAATDYNIPPKKERIAIIGAGAAGIGALLRLSTKKYHVEIFEKTDRMGGYLPEIVDPRIIQEDLSEQLEHQDYTVHYNCEIRSIGELAALVEEKDFDAVVVATGDGGTDFGLLKSVSEKGDHFCREYDRPALGSDPELAHGAAQDPTSEAALGSAPGSAQVPTQNPAQAQTAKCGWFAVGGVIGQELIDSMAAGLAMGTVVDNYLKTGHQYYPPFSRESALCQGMVTVPDTVPAVKAADTHYTKEEFAAEASRCVECKCSYCMDHCDLCRYTDKWPLRLKDEVVATTLEGKTELKATPARRLMSLCNQCGLCKEVCPEEIDMDTLFQVGRQKMFKQGKMPWAFHDYYRRDMEQANGEAALIRKPLNQATGKEYETCSYAFFPGCQLGAAEPEIVVKAYDSILFQHPDTAIFLQCCGIAAEWEGDAEGFQAVLDDIRTKWESLGKPTMILACMNCYQKFKEHLPEIPITSLYELLVSMKVSGGCNSENYSIFNPCSARNETTVREAVKSLAEDMGVKLHPLEENEESAKCCGYGGHGEIANEDYTDFVAEQRIADGVGYPFITYCINCRDMFKTHGQDAVHILELIYGMGASNTHLIHEHDHDHDHGGHEADIPEAAPEVSPSPEAIDAAGLKPEDLEAAMAEMDCDGNCSACSSLCGEQKSAPAPLPTVTERWHNRMELKQVMLALFWNEMIEIDDKMQEMELVMSDELKAKLDQKRIFEQDIAEVIAFCQKSGRTVSNEETGTLTGYQTIGHTTCWVEYRVLDAKQNKFEIVNAYTHRVQIELEAVWNGVRTEDE